MLAGIKKFIILHFNENSYRSVIAIILFFYLVEHNSSKIILYTVKLKSYIISNRLGNSE